MEERVWDSILDLKEFSVYFKFSTECKYRFIVRKIFLF